MNKKRVFIFSFLWLTLLCTAGEAFVPKAPHLLYLVIDKIRQPVGIEAFQTKKIINYTDTLTPYAELEERLLYAYPGRLRAELLSGPVKGFSVESQLQFVKVSDGVVISTQKSSLDRYSDILLYRDYESLLTQLDQAGVDTQQVGLHRYRDTICYVIGKPFENTEPFAGLWIEKDSFFPLKYVIKKDGWTVEFLYDKWQRVSRTWYPMQTSIFLDDKLHAMIDVRHFVLKSMGDDTAFDIGYIQKAYPKREQVNEIQENSRQVDELEKSVKDFGELFE